MKQMSTFKCKLVVLCCLFVVFALAFGAFFALNGNFALAEEEAQAPTIISVAGIAIGSSAIGNFPSAIANEVYQDADGNNYKVVATGSGTLTYAARDYETEMYGHMPEGLHLNSETGEFYGTITSTGTFGVSITVANEYGSANVLCYIQVYNESEKPVITTESLSKGAVGSSYYQSIEFSGAKYNGYTSKVVAGSLPDGLALVSNFNNAIVYGTPTQIGSYTFTVSIYNGAGTATKQYTIEITEENVYPFLMPKATIINESDQYSSVDKYCQIHVVKGKPVNIQLVASGTNTAETPITYSLYGTGAALPEGLTISETGLITGTPSNDIVTSSGETTIRTQIKVANTSVTGSPQSSSEDIIIVVHENGHVAHMQLNPSSASVAKGGTLQFEIVWEAYGDVDKEDVTWHFHNTGNTLLGATISNTGLLSVPIDFGNSYQLDVRVERNASGQFGSSLVRVADHTHVTELVNAVDKTCTTDGNVKHYKCTICDGLFEDALGTTVLYEHNVKIAASHEYGTIIGKVPATCSSAGMEAHFECSACHILFNSSKVETTEADLEIAIDETAHSYGTWHVEVPANCATEGTKAHKDCQYCNKHFDNENNKIVDLTIAKNDEHLPQDVWSKDASGHWHACTREGCKDGGKIDFAEHAKSAEAATETNDVHCTVCSYVIATTKSHEHGLTIVAGSSPSCNKNGAKTYYKCTEGENPCGKCFEDKNGKTEITQDVETWKVIPAAHTFGEWMVATQPTCGTTGAVAHKDCTVCHKHFDDKGVEIKDVVIPKNDDHLVTDNEKLESDQYGHWHVCTREGCKNNGKADYAEHTKSATEATETSDVHCTICQFIIEARKGHVHVLKHVEGTPATCTQKGTKEYWVCSEGGNPCGKFFEDENAKTEIPASRIDSWKVISVTHNFGEWVEGFAATCASTGEVGHKTCSLCKKNFDADGNELATIVIAKNNDHQTDSGWTKDETGHWYACTRECCKDGGKVNFSTHTKSANEPTETSDVHCIVCEYVIAEKGSHVHVLKLVEGTQATCTTPGAKGYYKCSEGINPCGKCFEDKNGKTEITEDVETWKVIPAAHTFGEWIEEVPATVDSEGTKAHKDCTVCGKHFDADGNEIADLTIAKLDAPSVPDTSNEPGNSLSGGAIAGIVVGSVVVAGAGGFAIFWFVIKKKKWADLVAIFKK